MGVYDRQIAQATKQITAKGELCQWISAGVPTSDPATPWINTDAEDTEHTVSILFTIDSVNPLFQLLSGSSVEASGQKAIMPPVPFTPKADDTVIRTDGTKLALKSATSLSPNGEIIMWKLVFKS